MNEILNKLALCVESGKINKTFPYPPNMKDQDGADELAKRALDEGVKPNDILKKALVPAMAIIGIEFSGKQRLIITRSMIRAIYNILKFTILFFLSTFCLKAQSQTKPIKTYYVFPEFLKGLIKMKNGHNDLLMMNYNMLTEEMIIEKNGIRLAISNIGSVDTVHIENRKFVPYDKGFYEIAVNAPITLFIQHKCKLISAGQPSGYGGTSQTSATTSLSALSSSGGYYKLDLPDDYTISNVTQFWIRKDQTFYMANSERQILKIFPEKTAEIKQIIKQYKLDVQKISDLTILVKKCNELGL
jgi:hypothetical protein